MNQDTSGRPDARPRPNDVLYPPQKVLTGPQRAQTGRFGGDAPPSNEPPSRVTSFNNTNQRSQPNDSSSSNNVWNPDRNNQQNFNNTGGSNQPTFGRQQSNPSQFDQNARNDESPSSGYNNSSRFPSNNFGNQQRSSGMMKNLSNSHGERSYLGGGFGQDERNDRQGSGNNDSWSQRGGFSNRGGYNNDRGGKNSISSFSNFISIITSRS